jgi:hypothetical protein
MQAMQLVVNQSDCISQSLDLFQPPTLPGYSSTATSDTAAVQLANSINTGSIGAQIMRVCSGNWIYECAYEFVKVAGD